MSNKNVAKLTVVDKAEDVGNKTKPKPLLGWLSHAIVLSILTPTAYLTGVAFHQAYMQTLKINYELYPKSSADYFLYAFNALFKLVPEWLQIAGTDLRVVGVVLYVSLVIGLINKGGSLLDNSPWMKRHREKAKTSKAFRLFGEIMLVPVIGLMVIYYIPILLVILMITPVLVGEVGGQKVANADKAGFEGGCAHPKRKSAFCTQMLEAGKPVAIGFVIDASDKFVAMIDNGVARSIPIKDREFSEFRNPIATDAHTLDATSSAKH